VQRAELEPEELERIRGASRVVTSLDRPVGEEGETSLGELMPTEGPAVEEAVELNLREEALREAIAQLPEREREVLSLRYGLDHDPMPLREIGRKLGITQERVRQIEGRALERLAQNRELAALKTAA
jgi:RNA polymerase primary sigma factor